MNTFTFGDSQMGYHETIAGGAGAGPSWLALLFASLPAMA